MAKFGKGGVKKMLVAIDGSESGMHALRESFKLAINEKSWITVVSVVPPYEGDLDMVGIGNVQHVVRNPCEKALSEAASIAESERAIIKTVCEEGVPHERIVDLAEAENCELIVMGKRGAGKIERALIGSVSARVIGYSQKDILIIPLKAAVDWSNILLATDGSKFSAAAAERAIDFAETYKGRLKVVSVVDVPAEFYGEAPEAVDNMIKKARGYTEEAKLHAESKGIHADSFVREGNTADAIISLAQEQKISTIVMGSHGRTGLRRLLMGSVTEKVIGHAACPVLIVKS